jgi:hypothetical protein
VRLWVREALFDHSVKLSIWSPRATDM